MAESKRYLVAFFKLTVKKTTSMLENKCASSSIRSDSECDVTEGK